MGEFYLIRENNHPSYIIHHTSAISHHTSAISLQPSAIIHQPNQSPLRVSFTTTPSVVGGAGACDIKRSCSGVCSSECEDSPDIVSAGLILSGKKTIAIIPYIEAIAIINITNCVRIRRPIEIRQQTCALS